MVNQMVKGLVDLIYGVQRKRRKFELANPNEKVLAADASKSITTNSDKDIRRGFNWVIAKRSVVMLTEKKIVCGKLTIPIEIISSAQLIKVPSMFGGGQVLKVHTTANKNYQFGMQFNSDWINQHQLPLTVVEGKVKYSTYSIIFRLIAVGYIIYWFYDRFVANH